MSNRRSFIKNISAGILLPSVLPPNKVLADAPMQKVESFADHWEFIGPSLQEPGYHVWGASPIMDEQGKVHLFASRWPQQYKVDPGWRSHSEIAHYVSYKPEGPFHFSDIALKGTGRNTWDKYSTENPAIYKVGDTYLLLFIANNNYHQPPHPSTQCIGMATSKSLYGPWKKMNKDGKILSPSTNKNIWTHQATNGVNNPAFLEYKGGYLLYFKSQNAKMGIAIAENLTGPYVQFPSPVTRNNKPIEDGYAFLYHEKVCLLTRDNHGIIKAGGGMLWRSDDAVSFNEFEPGFKPINEYVSADIIKNARWHYGPKNLMKFERPQLLMIGGEPAYLYVASGCNIYGGNETINYVLKFKR